jgi:hypothetical protein
MIGIRHSFHPDGTYWSAMCSASMQRERGTWRVLLDLSHVAFGCRYPVLEAAAVVDDFGTLVLLANDDGKVVLS